MKNFLIALGVAVVAAALIGIPLLQWDFWKVGLGGLVAALLFFVVSWGQGHISFSFKRCLVLFALLSLVAAVPARADMIDRDTGLIVKGSEPFVGNACRGSHLLPKEVFDPLPDCPLPESQRQGISARACDLNEVLAAAQAVDPYLRLSYESEHAVLAIYITPAEGLRRAAAAMEEKDAAINRFHRALEACRE